jgi:hypothetical protein
MGLDVYVGTFTRYYQRDWLTIVQQSFPGQVRVVRPNEEEPPDPAAVPASVTAWCENIRRGLGLESLWSEDAAQPYFTDKPAWDGYGGLLLWAAFDDQGIDPRCRDDLVTADNWRSDPVFKRYADRQVKTRYAQLLLNEEIWLPIPGPSVFRTTDPAGYERSFGNCRRLLDELELLNERTWKADARASEVWGRDGLQHGSRIEAAARFGWSLMHRLASEAVKHNLPMILDY